MRPLFTKIPGKSRISSSHTGTGGAQGPGRPQLCDTGVPTWKGPGGRTACCSPPGSSVLVKGSAAGVCSPSWYRACHTEQVLRSHSLNSSLPLMINCISTAVSLVLKQAACSCCVSCLCSVPELVTSTDFIGTVSLLLLSKMVFVLVREGFKRTRIHLGSCVAASAGWCCAAVEQAGSCSLLPTVRAGGLTSNPDTPFPPVFLKQNTHVCCPLAKSGFKQFI